MRRIFLAALVAMALTVPARAALNRWTSGGPDAGGPVDVLAFDPSQPGTVYAATYGGVFRSEDHGATWTSASFGLAAFQVSHIEVDPLHPGTVYAVTQRGFQKSQDGGRNWQVPVDMRVTAFAMAPSSPQTLHAADGAQIYSSFDAGASWDPGPVLPVEDDDVRILEIDPQTPANVYAGTYEGLFRSTDGGLSFVPLTRPGTGRLDGLSIDPSNPQILYAATFDGVFKSTDRGLTWTRAGQELAGKFFFQVAIDPTAPSNLLAAGGTQVYRSTDGGASWTLVFDRLIGNQTVTFDPASPSTYLLGTQDGVYRSTNQGVTWLSSNTGLFASLVRKLAVDPHRPGVLYAALHGTGSLHKSADAGASWSRLSLSGVRALALDPKTASRLYAATDKGIHRSQDAGSTWVRLNSAETSGSEIAIDPKTPSTLYLASSDGVRKSVDGGISWSATGPQPEDFSPFLLVIAPTAPQIVFAADFQNRLFKTTDGGATWTAVSGGGLPDEIVISLAVDPTNANVLYAGLENGFYKSTDGGATWSASGVGLPANWDVEGIAIDPSEPTRLYAAVSRRGIYRSTNGAVNWTLFDDGRPTDLAVDLVVLDPVNPFLLYAASYGSGVLARADLQPASSLRLNGDRFLVKMSWDTGQGLTGRGHTQALTGDTGYAWFFQESNVEVLLKVLNGCGITGHYWVFAAGLTNVRTDITVADTQTGRVKLYHNPVGEAFQPIQDTGALPCATTGSGDDLSARSAAAVSGPVLLRNGRFRVTAEFSTAAGEAPLPAQGATLTDDTAYLWFFDQNNVEVFLKVVNGCPVNDRFWVFAAGLTNVEVRITVEDTQNGTQKVYVNPRGTAFQPIQDTAAFGGCS